LLHGTGGNEEDLIPRSESSNIES
jgi:phospholipase/carboxylesterase